MLKHDTQGDTVPFTQRDDLGGRFGRPLDRFFRQDVFAGPRQRFDR